MPPYRRIKNAAAGQKICRTPAHHLDVKLFRNHITGGIVHPTDVARREAQGHSTPKKNVVPLPKEIAHRSDGEKQTQGNDEGSGREDVRPVAEATYKGLEQNASDHQNACKETDNACLSQKLDVKIMRVVVTTKLR